MQIITGNITGNVSKTYKDYLSRWTAIKFTGQNSKQILLINYYQSINHQNIEKALDAMVWSQQYVALQNQHLQPDPMKQSHIDLHQFIITNTTPDDSLLIVGDFNIELGVGHSGIHNIIRKHNLTDVQSIRHGLEGEVVTYARGQKRIDYVLASDDLLESFPESGVKPFNYRIHSDHIGLYVDLNKTHFFADVNDIQPKHQRDINAKHPKSNTKYINQVHKNLLANEVFTKVEKLTATMKKIILILFYVYLP